MKKIAVVNKSLLHLIILALVVLLVSLNQTFALEVNDVHYIDKCMKITQPGKYVINRSLSVDPKEKICLEINSSGVEVDGRMNKIFGFFELGSKAILINGNKTTVLSDIKIKNLIINGGYAGIKVKYAQAVQIESVFFKKPLEGLIIEDSSKVLLRDSRIDANQRSLVSLDSINLEIQDNTFSSEYSHCLDLKNSYYPLIQNNRFLYCKGSAIRLEKTQWSSIYKNSIKNSGKGSEVINSSQSSIKMNYIENCTQQGISIIHSSNVDIDINTMNLSQVGVFSQFSKQININGNRIENTNVGFLIDKCSNVNIRTSKISSISQYLFLIKESEDLFIDYGKINESKSLIQNSSALISLKNELIEDNVVYKDNANVTFLVINESGVIKTENLETLLIDKKNISIKPVKIEKETLIERISVKHVIILAIIVVILALIYSEIKLLNEKQRHGRRRRR